MSLGVPELNGRKEREEDCDDDDDGDGGVGINSLQFGFFV